MKNSSKIKGVFVCVCVLMIACSVCSSASYSNIDSYSQEFDFGKITSGISDETAEILNELGINEISAESIFSVSISKVFSALVNMGKNAFSEPLKYLAGALGVLLLTSAALSFNESSVPVSLIGSSVLALALAVPVANAVTTAFSVLESLCAFTVGFAGVFGAIVSASGKVALGTSYASLAVVSNTLISSFLSGFSAPAINGMCSLSFLSCFDVYNFNQRVTALIKRVYISFLGFAATMFSGVVTLKGVMGAGVDSITSRGVKFVVGRSLPIVGGAVSETYSALVSSLSLIKSTVGIFGILTVVITVLPVFLQLGAWVVVLEIIITASTFLDAKNVFGMLNVLKDSLILLMATVVFSGVIFVVTVGVVIFVKGV